MSGLVKQQCCVLAVAGSVLLTGLGSTHLWDRDEPRNAGCASGDAGTRRAGSFQYFNGELRAHKPILLYWLMMSAYTLLGVSEFSARIWSAVLGDRHGLGHVPPG